LIGSGLAHGYAPEKFSWTVAVLCLLFAWFVHVAANLINDVVDFQRGLDKSDPERIDRIYANGLLTRRAMYVGTAVCLVIGCLVGLTILWMVHDKLIWGGWEILAMGAVIVACTFLYSVYFAYHGLGDLAVLLCFGIIPVCITYYVQLHTVTWQVFTASVACGAVIDGLLIVNNYRDRDNDARDGKKTLVVMIGAERAEWLYLGLGLFAVAAGVVFWLNGHVVAFVLPFIYLLMHVFTWLKMKRIHAGRQLNECLGETARNILIYGLCVAIGLLLV